MSSVVWQIRLLGDFRAQQGERTLTRFSTYKTGALLAYLALHPDTPQSREALLELFWPDAPTDAARNSLSAALSSLRRQFEPPGTPAGAFVQADRQTVRLNPGSFRTDAAAYESAAQAALGAAAESRIAGLEAAAALYHGPLLPSVYEDWAGAERERLADLYLTLLNALVQHLADGQAFERALTYAHRAIQADPLREASHRTLMRLHTATGRPMAALEHYRHLETLLKQSLDVAPSRKTFELAREIAEKIGQPDLPASAPPILSIPFPDPVSQAVAEKAEITGSLPLTLTRFFGREADIARVREMLVMPDVRLVTLTGPGGIGKSRLSLEAAQNLREAFRDRVWFIPLVDVTEGASLVNEIRDGLRLPRESDKEPHEQIVEALAGSPSLLVLDNFEQLAAAGAPVLQALLEKIPGVTCLVTSRQPLEIDGERQYPVSPLPTPPEGAGRQAVAETVSVRLFTDRAQARRVDFGVTPGNYQSVAALCRALEGIPLALELAAGWARMLTPAQMLARLSQRFDLLTSKRPDLPERHRTLRAAIDSTVGFLPESLQQFFARLSAFRGGWTLEAAQEVSNNQEDADACLDHLRRLQERSLIVAEEAGDTMRYRMLETIREYGADLLTSEESDGLLRRHAEFFGRWAAEAREALTGPEQIPWLDRLERERANLRAALDWSLRHDLELALRIPEAVWRFWEIRGYRLEGRLWLEEALCASAAETAEPVVKLRAHVLNVYGQMLVGLGNHAQARIAHEESLELFRRFDNKISIASVLNNIGVLMLNQDDYAAARPIFEETLALKRELGDERSLASTLSNLGQVAVGLRQISEARAYFQESLAIARKHGLNWGIAHLLSNLADLAFEEGDAAECLSLQRQSLPLWQQLGDRDGFAQSLLVLSSLLLSPLGRIEPAVRLAACAIALMDETGFVLRPNMRATYNRQSAEVRALLGEDRYQALLVEGGRLSLAEAVDEALAEAVRL